MQLNFNDPGRLDGAGDNYLAVGVPWRGGHGHDVSTVYKATDGEVFSACVAAAFYRTEVFKAAGGFGEDYFCYVEDVDLEFRLRLFRGVYVDTGRCVAPCRRCQLGFQEICIRYLSWRSRYDLDIRKNMSGPLFWQLFPAHIVVLAVLLAKACLRSEGAFVARGIRDAVGGMSSVWEKRKLIQARRKASVTGIAAALVWNIGTYLGKKDRSPECYVTLTIWIYASHNIHGGFLQRRNNFIRRCGQEFFVVEIDEMRMAPDRIARVNVAPSIPNQKITA